MLERISMQILSDKIVDDSYDAKYSYEIYKSWWQHFKHDYMPEWFTDKYPVDKKTVTDTVTVKFTRYAEYPKANVRVRGSEAVFYRLGNFERIVDTVEQTK